MAGRAWTEDETLAGRAPSFADRLTRGRSFRGPLHASLVLLLLALTIVPIAVIVVGSFRPLGLLIGDSWTTEHYVKIWTDPFTYRVIGNTLVFSGGSTVLGISVALVLAWLFERTDLAGRRIYKAGIIMPMVTPPLLLAMGWVLLMSPAIGFLPALARGLVGFKPGWMNIYGLGGMIFIMGLAYVPTAVLIFSPVMHNMDPAYEEASRMSGATSSFTIRRISLPFLMPSIVSTTTLFFIVGMLAFDVPAIIGNGARVVVMSTEIYELLHGELEMPDYGGAAAFNSALFVFLLLFLAVYWRMVRNSRHFVTVGGRAFRATRYRLGRWRWAATGFVALYFLLGVFLPFFALIWVSLTPYFSGFSDALLSQLSLAAFAHVLGEPRFWTALVNATTIGLVAALGSLALALAVARVNLHSEGQIGRLVGPLAMLPLGIPHLMLGVALIFMMLNMRFLGLYGTIWIIAIGHIIAYLPVSSRMMELGMMQLSRELEEAAMTSGARLLQRLRGIIMPPLTPTFVALFIWIFVHSVREFSIAVILQSGKNEVLSTLMFNYWSNSFPNYAAAVSTIMMVSLFALAVVFGWFTRERPGQ